MALISRHRQTCGPPLPPSAGFGCSGPFHVFHLVIQTRCQNHPTPHPALLSSLDPAINDSILSSTERYEREVTAVGDTLIPTKPTTPKQNKNKTPTRYIHHVYEALLCLDGFSDQNRPPPNCKLQHLVISSRFPLLSGSLLLRPHLSTYPILFDTFHFNLIPHLTAPLIFDIIPSDRPTKVLWTNLVGRLGHSGSLD